MAFFLSRGYFVSRINSNSLFVSLNDEFCIAFTFHTNKSFYKSVRSFLQSFFPTFVIVMFILLMQVVWLYVDELVGKGLEWSVIAELMFYFSASLIPQALPLSVLLSSIMTFGNLGESYELVAAKAAGISTMKIFRPMILVMVGISLFAFFVSNILIPQANLKRSSLLYDVRQQKPSLAISEGVFYTGIEGITMRVGKKDKTTQEMFDIMIYDQRENNMFPVIITAKHGTMGMSEDKRFLFFKLYDGARYEEMEKQDGYYNSYPQKRPILKPWHSPIANGCKMITIQFI
ncbi:MAG: LptF/LptG family permease [Bacteroidetes bacterium]|nr:LptF/LptG family permease [Bacteroidota bacterium]